MNKLICNQEKVNAANIDSLIKCCHFNAIENKDGKIEINSGCKMCKLCVKNGPVGIMEFIVEKVAKIDKSLWNGIGVYVDHIDGVIHPVTL